MHAERPLSEAENERVAEAAAHAHGVEERRVAEPLHGQSDATVVPKAQLVYEASGIGVGTRGFGAGVQSHARSWQRGIGFGIPHADGDRRRIRRDKRAIGQSRADEEERIRRVGLVRARRTEVDR